MHRQFDQFARHSQHLITMALTTAIQAKNPVKWTMHTTSPEQLEELQQQYRENAEQVRQAMFAFGQVKHTRFWWLTSLWCLPPTMACHCRIRLARALHQARQTYHHINMITLQDTIVFSSPVEDQRQSGKQILMTLPSQRAKSSRYAWSRFFIWSTKHSSNKKQAVAFTKLNQSQHRCQHHRSMTI